MMENNCQNVDSNSKYLLEQLITARKEISNLRQQIKSLRYVHERDVSSIKRLLGLCTSGLASFPEESASSQVVQPNSSLRDHEPSTSQSIDDCSLTCRPIGTISTWFPSKRGTPRQAVICGKAPGRITLNKTVFTNPEHALQGLEEFSHMWILFHFHKNELAHVRAKVAPPRLNGLRTGVFSTRSPHRPCPIGLSLVKILKIEDYSIYFEGVDMVDQTPVLDIKPYIPHYDNPLHIDKVLHAVHSKEDMTESETVETFPTNNMDDWNPNDLDEATSVYPNDISHLPNQRIINYTDSLIDNQTLVHVSSSSSSPIDISRDEELALRLQAEEFQENPSLQAVQVQSQNVRPNLNRTGFDATVSQEAFDNDDHNLGNSRLLDGADGPNAVCGTDLDLISRRALNLRLDDSSSSSSPVRMGVREAPDGEEGFDLPQTYNTSFGLASSTASNDNTNPYPQTIDRHTNDNSAGGVRVPDWISRPKTSILSVVFNERSLLQLHEILKDKADEKRRAVENILKEDPRSVYLRRRYGNQFYTFLIHDLHITCRFDDDRKIVTVFQIRHAGRICCECGQPEWQCTGHSPPSI
ncbi:tRNA (adenine(37)-N6)-methyltransferase [Nasonia vitripennis]|uniref:TsaA-like domain-containing protein n=1 Tax=Nasonia vitripennis TaxID=7425 RepID=A0A7M7HE53_NASVI|nr:tRNA (adenine(37)-N6)-methyltransferase [Nasonia vitripennis]